MLLMTDLPLVTLMLHASPVSICSVFTIPKVLVKVTVNHLATVVKLTSVEDCVYWEAAELGSVACGVNTNTSLKRHARVREPNSKLEM